MLWIVLAFNAALFQALGAALKKKSQVSGMNNIIGSVSFLTAGIVFGVFFFAKTGRIRKRVKYIFNSFSSCRVETYRVPE